MSTISKKRKADELDQPSDAGADRRPDKIAATDAEPLSPPHLPASCLAAVLNFLPYTAVRKCILAGKIMAIDAAGQVETLNIMKPSELVALAARRFRNVSELNVLCLISRDEEFDHDNDDDDSDDNDEQHVLSVAAAIRAIPFISTFPKLRKVFLGGLVCDEFERFWYRTVYDQELCAKPEDHETVYRSLMENLCGAIQAKTLSPNIDFGDIGLCGTLPRCANNGAPGRPCHFCRNIITSFPTETVLESLPYHHYFCGSPTSRLSIFLQREGIEAALLSSAGQEMMVSMLNSAIRIHHMNKDTSVERDFGKRMKKKGALECNCVRYLAFRRLQEEVDILGKKRIESIPRSFVARQFYLSPSKSGYKQIVLRQTFDAVVALGFNLDPNDYIFVDLNKEPALAGLKFQLERQEEEIAMERQEDGN